MQELGGFWKGKYREAPMTTREVLVMTSALFLGSNAWYIFHLKNYFEVCILFVKSGFKNPMILKFESSFIDPKQFFFFLYRTANFLADIPRIVRNAAVPQNNCRIVPTHLVKVLAYQRTIGS